MKYAGIAVLVLGYMMSQFFRAMLAVMEPSLAADLGAAPADLADASGAWFITFALMQIPVGAALDRYGPRLTTSVLFLVGGAGGALIFALSSELWQLTVAMALIGIGCAPILMASYFIFARDYPAAAFATLGAMVLALGSIGNILASLPMTWAIEAFGWRPTLWGLAALSFAVSAAVFVFVHNPPKGPEQAKRGSVLDLLKMPKLWPLFAIMLANYAPAASVRGLWGGPLLTDRFEGISSDQVGFAMLLMGIAMVIGNFAYGPLDRIFHTRKWVVVIGNAISCAGCMGLFLFAEAGSFVVLTALMALVGAAAASFAVIIAHGRTFFPPHLTGRGVTLLNLFGIMGVGIMQFATGNIFVAFGEGSAAYSAVFGFMALWVAIGVLIYTTSEDRLD